MRLTPVLCYRHPKYYYYASKFRWGLKKYKENFHKKWRFEINIHKKLPVEDYVTERKFEIPPGYVIKNPVDYMESIREKYDFKALPKERPWPFNEKPIEGSTTHPDYKEKRELFFNRATKLFEGYKGALSFTNTVLQSDEKLPDRLVANEERLVLDREIVDMLARRLEWADKLDSTNARVNNRFEFPRINKWALPKYGPTLDRKERNVLNTYADCSDLLIAKQFGYFHCPKVLSPKYEIAFMRGENRCILDLRSDFITLQQDPLGELLSSGRAELNEYLKSKDYLFCGDVEGTKQKELLDIRPLTWEINFDKTHFYADDEQLNRPSRVVEQNVDTVYLGNQFNIHKFTPDRVLKGKLLLFLYGYAVGRARYLYGNPANFGDEVNYRVLDRPVLIKGVFANYSKRNLGFACLQLNTLSFESDVKNLAWFDGPYDIIEEQETILKKLAAMNLDSYELLQGGVRQQS